MSIIIDMVSGDRRRHSRSWSTSEDEAPSSISIAAPAPLLESPALVDPSEMNLSEVSPSEMDPSGIIILFI